MSIFSSFAYPMPLVKDHKTSLIKKHGRSSADTGSPEVQVALLSGRIVQLTEHMKVHKKDYHSRRGLLLMVGQRRRLLDFVKKASEERYQKIVADLGLRR